MIGVINTDVFVICFFFASPYTVIWLPKYTCGLSLAPHSQWEKAGDEKPKCSLCYLQTTEWMKTPENGHTYSENIESNEGSVFSFCIYFVWFLFVNTGKLFVHIFQTISLFNFPLVCWWVSFWKLFCGLFHIWVVKIKIKNPEVYSSLTLINLAVPTDKPNLLRGFYIYFNWLLFVTKVIYISRNMLGVFTS